MKRFLEALAGTLTILMFFGLAITGLWFLAGFGLSVDEHLSFAPTPVETSAPPDCYPGTCWTDSSPPAGHAPVEHAPPIQWWMLAAAFGALVLIVGAITAAVSADGDDAKDSDAEMVSAVRDYVDGRLDVAEMESRLDVALGLKRERAA